VREVRLLGYPGKLGFRQADGALEIDVPATLPSRHASAFRIGFA
jgi:alpha-L-fucosidase